ncbi:hypothetical protein AAG570_007667 [Ranatra chinensis]|uniref:Uncharacterized protein n=1 Tax=Ranatra chinensis TaxID=642074 RepID=A0ABD0Y7F4_9HEMI
MLDQGITSNTQSLQQVVLLDSQKMYVPKKMYATVVAQPQTVALLKGYMSATKKKHVRQVKEETSSDDWDKVRMVEVVWIKNWYRHRKENSKFRGPFGVKKKCSWLRIKKCDSSDMNYDPDSTTENGDQPKPIRSKEFRAGDDRQAMLGRNRYWSEGGVSRSGYVRAAMVEKGDQVRADNVTQHFEVVFHTERGPLSATGRVRHEIVMPACRVIYVKPRRYLQALMEVI